MRVQMYPKTINHMNIGGQTNEENRDDEQGTQ